MDLNQDFIQWAISQGVAVAVLAFVLVRLDGRLADVMTKVDVLIGILTKVAKDGGA